MERVMDISGTTTPLMVGQSGNTLVISSPTMPTLL